jgi:hypothetical protein
MAVYLGYYRVARSYQDQMQERAREQRPGLDEKFRELILGLPEKVPAGCRIDGSYPPMGAGAVLRDPGPPSVMIVETESTSDLAFISRYYTGYLAFEWTPANHVGGTREERETWQTAMGSLERESME